MPAYFGILLWVAAIATFSLRFAPTLPLRRRAIALSTPELVLTGAGMLGLLLHCTSMFTRSWLDWLPGIDPVLDQINGMGVASVVWYVVPCALVLAGMRRMYWPGLGAIVAALLFVGVTMYNGSPLLLHLISLLVLVIVLGLSTSMLVRGPTPAPAPNGGIRPRG